MLNLIPKTIRRKIERPLKKFFYFGNKKFCPICKSSIRAFYPDPQDGRPGAVCPVCNSQERFRMLWTFIDSKYDELFANKPCKILHVAPEREIEKRLRGMPGIDYLSADLENPNAMMKMDLTSIQFEDNYFDTIICCHVLEHIPDDVTALKELFRVVKPGGSVLIQVPGLLVKTFEDTSDMNINDRKFIFRHESHYHLYGLDLIARMTEVGFTANYYYASDILNKDKCLSYGINQQRMFYGIK